MPTANSRKAESGQLQVQSQALDINEKAKEYIEKALERSQPNHPRLFEYYKSRGLSVPPSDYLGYVGDELYSENGAKQSLPAMLAFLQDVNDVPVGVQRTYLDPNGSGKAQVPTPKKLAPALYSGATKGAAIHLHDLDGETLAIAEGIETAESVYQATNVAAWSTVSAGGMEHFVAPKETRKLQIWADNDTNLTGQKAAARLAKRLYGEGISVKVFIPHEPDTDWNDVLISQGEDGIRHALDAAVWCDPNNTSSPSPDELYRHYYEKPKRTKDTVQERRIKTGNALSPEEALDFLNMQHFVVLVGGRACIASEKLDPISGYFSLDFMGKSDFFLLYQNKSVNDGERIESAAKFWISSPHRREYVGIDFFPGKNIPNYYNLWQGFTVEPQPGDCSLYWKHIHSVICRGNDNHYRYVRKWMAHMVQRPEELPGVALVIRGKQGTGKTIFVDFLGKLFGPHYMTVTRMDQLTGRFNGHIKDKLLVCANEAVWGGDKQGEGMLKSLITDQMTPIELKGKDIISVRNLKRVVVTTNERWAVPMGMDDRRFLVLEPSDEHKEDILYFKALSDQMDNGGLEALLYDLQHEDLDGVDVRTAPRSNYNFDIKHRSAEPLVRWWFEKLYEGYTVSTTEIVKNGDPWNDSPAKSSLHADFIDFCDTYGLRKLDKAVFGKEFAKLLPGGRVKETRRAIQSSQDDSVTILDGQPKRARFYLLPTLAECRAAFEELAKAGPEIWSDENTLESGDDQLAHRVRPGSPDPLAATPPMPGMNPSKETGKTGDFISW